MLLNNRYRIIKKLGQGGFGRTFEVDDNGTLRVLKVLNLTRFLNPETQQKAISLFKREAEVLKQLNYSGVPKVYEYFTLGKDNQKTLHCLVMEKIEGVNLKQWLKSRDNQPITQEQAITWLQQLIGILKQLHDNDLIHRDIKPSNIMLRPTGELVLIDFGAVRQVTQTYLNRQEMKATGTVIVSLGYTPQEQAEGRAVPQSDFFALGRTLVHLLTGKVPIDFEKDRRSGKLNWRENAPQVSKEFADLIDYMMNPFPGKRPQTTDAIARCLEEITSPPEPLPPVPQKPEKPALSQGNRNSDTGGTWKQQGVIKLISRFLPTMTSSNPWQKAKLRYTLSGHSDIVRGVAVSADGHVLASCSYDRTIKLWAPRTGKLLQTLVGHTDRINCIAISPDDQILASGSFDRTIKLWALHTGELLHTLNGHSAKVRHLAFSPNGQMLISIGREVLIWATLTGKLLDTLIEKLETARVIAFSSDGQTCAIGKIDSTVELWNPHSRKRLLPGFASQSAGVTCIAFSPDGQILAIGSGAFVELWNLDNRIRLGSLLSHSGGVKSIAFSPDGQTLVVGNEKKFGETVTTIELWNPHLEKLLYTLGGHANAVRSVAFSPDGCFLVSGSEDRTIKIWQPA